MIITNFICALVLLVNPIAGLINLNEKWRKSIGTPFTEGKNFMPHQILCMCNHGRLYTKVHGVIHLGPKFWSAPRGVLLSIPANFCYFNILK